MRTANTVPIISIVGASGVGKTTLLEKLIPELIRRRLKVGTIKHDVHGFQMDRPGKDSWRHKQAGATCTIISSPRQIAMVKDVDTDQDPEALAPLLAGVDIIITEGYKYKGKAKLEVFRPQIQKEPICKDDRYLLAIITDAPLDLGVPVFKPDDVSGLAGFLDERFHLTKSLSRNDEKKIS